MGKEKDNKDELRINDAIRVPQVRVVNENTQNLGVIATSEAMRLANEANLDLVEVAPDADPPVCRIMDYGKHKYRLKKKQHQSHVHTHHVQLKELRLSPVIEEHDIEVKLKRARDFLSRGDRVTFNMMFRGRQIMHSEVGRAVMERIAKNLEDVAKLESSLRQEGKRLFMTVAPKSSVETKPKPAVGGAGAAKASQTAAPKGGAETKAKPAAEGAGAAEGSQTVAPKSSAETNEKPAVEGAGAAEGSQAVAPK